MLTKPETPVPENAFRGHRESILKSAKKLVEDTKNLVIAAQESQAQSTTSAKDVLISMTKLVDKVKLGAAALGTENSEAHIMLLMTAKDVAGSLTDLIVATKNSSGKPADDPTMETLKTSAKTMVTSVTSLLDTVRSVNEASQSVQTIESTVDAIKENNLQIGESKRNPSLQDLIRATKGVTLATAKAVAAGNSGKQEDVVEAANIGRRNCTEIMKVVKAAAFNAESKFAKAEIVDRGLDTTRAYCEVLDHVASVIVHPCPEKKRHLTMLSKRVAHSVTELIKTAQGLEDSKNSYDLVDNELLGAAESMEIAARKLAQLKPCGKPKQATPAKQAHGLEEQILEAARSITIASAAVVKAATSAQKELVATGKVSPAFDGGKDGQWSQGLISAAALVAATTGSLCEIANAGTQDTEFEEKLIASAKAITHSTSQLLLACRVKADPNSKAQKCLQSAGVLLKNGAESLVNVVRGSVEKERIEMSLSSLAGGFRDELEVQEMILRKEKELEKARAKLFHIRKARYYDYQKTSYSVTEKIPTKV